MKEYEKQLKQLISLSNDGCDPVDQAVTGMSEGQLRFLSAKGLIDLIPAGDDEFWITIEPAGLAYFSNKSEKRSGFIKEHLASFLTGFVSGVLTTVLATWLIQLLL